MKDTMDTPKFRVLNFGSRAVSPDNLVQRSIFHKSQQALPRENPPGLFELDTSPLKEKKTLPRIPRSFTNSVCITAMICFNNQTDIKEKE
jgi:hypothetical protein